MATNEPVLVGTELLSLLFGSGTAAGLVSLPDVSTAAKVAVPIVVMAVLKAAGWQLRKYVSPAWKAIQVEGEKVGVTVPPLEVAAEDVVQAISADPAPAAIPA